MVATSPPDHQLKRPGQGPPSGPLVSASRSFADTPKGVGVVADTRSTVETSHPGCGDSVDRPEHPKPTRRTASPAAEDGIKSRPDESRPSTLGRRLHQSSPELARIWPRFRTTLRVAPGLRVAVAGSSQVSPEVRFGIRGRNCRIGTLQAVRFPRRAPSRRGTGPKEG